MFILYKKLQNYKHHDFDICHVSNIYALCICIKILLKTILFLIFFLVLVLRKKTLGNFPTKIFIIILYNMIINLDY